LDPFNKKAFLSEIVSEYGGIPNDSIIYELDKELKFIYSEHKININSAVIFKYSLAQLLNDRANFEKLEYLTNKIINNNNI